MDGVWTTRKRLRLALIGMLVVIAGAVVASMTESYPVKAGALERPVPTASNAQSVTGNGQRLQLGLSYGDTLLFASDHDLAAGLNDAVALGARWIRVDLAWSDIQPDRPADYQWRRFDRVVNGARARGLSVLPTVGYTPSWARAADCHGGQSCPPADPRTFARFAAAAAARYAAMGVHTWEIWNEPNISSFWRPKPDAVAYTELLNLTTTAVRQADSKAYLLMGGLAAVQTIPNRGYVSAVDFLTAVSQHGGNRMVQALSYHPYSYPYLPTAVTTFGTAFERISSYQDNLIAVLDRYGTPGLPVWITETGAPTYGPGNASDGKSIPPNTTHVTEAFQADIASQTIQAAANNSHVAAVFWFGDRDIASTRESNNRTKFFGLRRKDGTAKPAFQALEEAIAAYRRNEK